MLYDLCMMSAKNHFILAVGGWCKELNILMNKGVVVVVVVVVIVVVVLVVVVVVLMVLEGVVNDVGSAPATPGLVARQGSIFGNKTSPCQFHN